MIQFSITIFFFFKLIMGLIIILNRNETETSLWSKLGTLITASQEQHPADLISY